MKSENMQASGPQIKCTTWIQPWCRFVHSECFYSSCFCNRKDIL